MACPLRSLRSRVGHAPSGSASLVALHKATPGVVNHLNQGESIMANNTHPKNSNQPSHLVYHVEEWEGDQGGIWTKIGACWPHQDGKGYNLQLQFLPLNANGRLTIRLNEPKEKQSAA